MLSDLRLSFRALTKSPGFALVAILTLGVGIGATTAIFSVLQALVISPYHFPSADRLVHVWSGDRWPLSPASRCARSATRASFAGATTSLLM